MRSRGDEGESEGENEGVSRECVSEMAYIACMRAYEERVYI